MSNFHMTHLSYDFWGRTKTKIACFLIAYKFQDEKLMRNIGFAGNKFHYDYHHDYNYYYNMYKNT